jgi:hypothetical protein
MVDFFDSLAVDSKLRKAVGPYINKLLRQPLRKLLLHDERNGWWRCPICYKAFSERGGVNGFVRMKKHFRWRLNRWEFTRLLDNIDKLPNKFHYYQHDFSFDESHTKLKNIARRWVICAKLLKELNPKAIFLDYKEDKQEEIDSNLKHWDAE